MKLSNVYIGFVAVGLTATVACANDVSENMPSVDQSELRGAATCQSPTLGRKVRKYDCVQDAACHWNQCQGGESWGGFSNDVCAPKAPWQSAPCNGGSDAARPGEGTYPFPGCPFYVPAVGDDGKGTCEATTKPAAVCISALNPNATIQAFDCFEHGDAWWQCNTDGEWASATLEASGKVYGALGGGCATTHRR